MSETLWDAPNQQVVRPDESPPWQEGTGGGEPPANGGTNGGTAESAPASGATPTTEQLDAMTKDELLATAQSLGVSPANAAMTKDEIRAGIDAKLAGG